jgi:hypothetical protein
MQENDSFLVMEAEKRFLTCNVRQGNDSFLPCSGGREKIPTL